MHSLAPFDSIAQKNNERVKLQTPSSKLQGTSKHQAPNTTRKGDFGIWSLVFLWSLELGVWSLFLLACALSCNAAEYYVSPAGNDTNPGTLAAPFYKISKAVPL